MTTSKISETKCVVCGNPITSDSITKYKVPGIGFACSEECMSNYTTSVSPFEKALHGALEIKNKEREDKERKDKERANQREEAKDAAEQQAEEANFAIDCMVETAKAVIPVIMERKDEFEQTFSPIIELYRDKLTAASKEVTSIQVENIIMARDKLVKAGFSQEQAVQLLSK